MVWLAGWSAGTAFLLHQTWTNWVSVFVGPGSRIANIFSALFMTLFAVPFTGGLIFGLFIFSQSMSPWASAPLVVGGILAYVFYHLLKAPTALGAQTLDQIDGFKMFLLWSTAEKDRLEMLHPPAGHARGVREVPALRHCAALDCENQWSKKFEAEAAAPCVAGLASRPMPTRRYWYTGSNFANSSAPLALPRPSAHRSAAPPRRRPPHPARVRAAAAAASRAAAGAAVAAVAGRAALLLCLLFASAAHADDIERITDFRDDVTVARDGTVTVTETIAVNAQGDSIIHGIFRDFPTIYRTAGNTHVRFDVTSIQVDGHDTPFDLQTIDNGKRVQIGDADAARFHARAAHLRPALHYRSADRVRSEAGRAVLERHRQRLGFRHRSRCSAVIRLPAECAQLLGAAHPSPAPRARTAGTRLHA